MRMPGVQRLGRHLPEEILDADVTGRHGAQRASRKEDDQPEHRENGQPNETPTARQIVNRVEIIAHGHSSSA